MNAPIAGVLRGAPWRAIAGVSASACVVGATGVALAHNPVGPTLLATAFGLFSAAAAFALDEPASAVVDVTPTGPARQAAARALALSVPLAGGVALVVATSLRDTHCPGPA